jgi:hypothetical protein
VEERARRVRQADHRLSLLRRKPRDEPLGERRNVLPPLAERRQREGKDADAIIEILAEPPGGDLGREVAVGGGDEADVGLHRPRAAHRVHLALLHGAEELHLRLGRQFTDLVQEKRAAVRLLELADPASDGAGEGALLMAEED